MRASYVLGRFGAGKGELEEDGGLAESSPRFAEAEHAEMQLDGAKID